MSINQEDVINALGNMSVMEMISLTKELEQKWGVKAEPKVSLVQNAPVVQTEAQTEFTVVLASYPADKKIALVKLVRELTGLGLKEAKELVEAVPKSIKESVTKDEATELTNKLTAAGGIVEVK
jgi:large subunit ribosomal protein L7/L12